MENTNQIIEKIEKVIKKIFFSESSGHDIFHLKRVLNNALHIQKKEGGDKTVIAIAAFLHDVHRIVQNKTGKYCSPKDSLPKVKEILKKVGLDEAIIKKVLHCIEFHEEYNFSEKGKSVKDIETLILQDADNLDAMGAIGIARAFMYGGATGVPMWLPDIPFVRKFFDESINDPSEIHHFYSKLLKLKDDMNTKTGKQMAILRHRFMKNYLDEFFAEWEGKR